MRRTYQAVTTTAATTIGGMFVDIIAPGHIKRVTWSCSAVWAAATGSMAYWLSKLNTNNAITSQIYDHISNFHANGSFTAAGTHFGGLNFCDLGLNVPVKLGERIYLHAGLTGTGPASIITACLIDVEE